MSEIKKAFDILSKKFLNKKIKLSLSIDGTILFDGINNKDIIGGLLQNCFYKILYDNNIDIKQNEKTQEFPDFFINKESVEIKSYDINKKPAFDVANFDSFCSGLEENPKKRLNAKYIILGYSFNEKDFSIKITKIFIKNLYEICSKRNILKPDQLNLPLKCQVKKNMIYNIRPINKFDDFTKEDIEQKQIKSNIELITLVAECKEISLKKSNIAFDKKNWIENILKQLD